MSLAIGLLKNVVERSDGSIVAQCPACAAEGVDQFGKNHLIIYPNGKFGCVLYPRDYEGSGFEKRTKHLKKIFQLAGVPDPEAPGGVGGQYQSLGPKYGKTKNSGRRW